MKPITSQKPRQSRPVENARREHAYLRTPEIIARLPACERAAAREVWDALHYYLRLGATPRRVTDEDLHACPCLADRSFEHIGKGIQILDRLGLISRDASGSRRELAILATLKGARPAPEAKAPAPAPKPIENDAFVPLARPFWELVRESQRTGT